MIQKNINGAKLFGYYVKNPSDYGIAEFKNKKIYNIVEKPDKTKSNIAITGLYFYDNSVVNLAKKVTPSDRNELEISSLNRIYLNKNKIDIKILHRGFTWFDTGTFHSIYEASNFVQIIENKQSFLIGCIEEIAIRNKWTNKEKIRKLLNNYGKTEYREYLEKLISNVYE